MLRQRPMAFVRILQLKGQQQSDFYQTESFQIPEDIVLEAGAIEWMGEDQLLVSTRLGDIYLVESVLGDHPSESRFQRYASGLHEVLGLAKKDDWVYCIQRCELTRMKDEDGDGRADLFETINADWGITGDYHEYAFSSKFDREGNIWVVLCLTGSFTSEIDYRGWCLRITPWTNVANLQRYSLARWHRSQCTRRHVLHR